MKFVDKVDLVSGTPPARLETYSGKDYPLYNQEHLEADLNGLTEVVDSEVTITTASTPTSLLAEGDVVMSLISGQAACVSQDFAGYFYSHNFVKLIPDEDLDANYLVYLLNEDRSIHQQLLQYSQGSQVIKYTLKLLKSLDLGDLPPLDKQKMIGQIYKDSRRLHALKQRREALSLQLVLKQLER